MPDKPKKERSKTYRLTAAQVEFIDALVEKGLFGANQSEVVRALIDYAIRDVVQTRYVENRQATLEALKKK